MNNIIFILLSLFLLSSCQTTGRLMNSHSGYGNYKDDDWNESFYANARLPSSNSIKWIKENENQFLRFTLKDKDKGWAHTDRKRRHSAPYWERAELKQRFYLRKDTTYEIKFKVRFIEGFEGGRETFFQVHQWQEYCKVGPPMMLKFSTGMLRLDAKQTKAHHGIYYPEPKINIKDMKNEWNAFRIIYSTLEKSIVIFLNNKELTFIKIPSYEHNKLYTKINFVPYECGIPHIKFGIYRPGNTHNPIKTSIVDFDKFEIREIK